LFKDDWSALHGDVEIKGVTKYWLSVAQLLIKPFVLFRISPNFVSLLSLLSSLPLVVTPNYWWLILLSLVLDGIDGSLAIVTTKTSKFGAALDSILDRCVEFIWAVALYKVGIHLGLLAVFIGAAWSQEYLRARAGGLGVKRVSKVSLSERPVRAIFILLAVAFSHWSALIIVIATIFQLTGFLQIFRTLNKDLKK